VTDRILTVLRHEDPSGAVVVTVTGELDHHTAPELTRTVRDLPFTAEPPTVIDLTELGYCDSTGMTVLVAAYQRAKAQNSGLVIAGLDSGLLRVFQIAGLDQLLTFAPSVGDAVRLLKPTFQSGH
jgi:anti-sigma B factor antagonist